ncbi:MAG: M20/M25/M40 family metallo-hydrolase [Halioglobus sp.]|nr:M20/M25/M40 family metallo-hydrolase [Halioglobus sp.]
MPRLFVVILAGLLLGTSMTYAGVTPAERLSESIQFRTVSYQDRSHIDLNEFERFHTFLRAAYPKVFAQLEVEVINNYSLLIRWPGKDGELAPILFTAHMDVVPIESGTEGDWEFPPFDGVVANGRIYGRGSLDNKQGVLSLLEAAESLLAEDFSPSRQLVFAFGHDEEISGKQGARKIADRMREQGLHFAWMVDEGGMLVSDNPMVPDQQLAIINVAEKGYLTLTLVATGEGGHSSMPPRVSTIGRLSAALERIENNPFPTRLVVPVKVMLESMAPHLEQPERLILGNLWLTERLVTNRLSQDPLMNSFVRTTTALTMFNAGLKENVVPQRAEAKVNFRLLPGDTPEMVVNYISDVVNDPEIEISYDEWDYVPGLSDHEGTGYAVIAGAVSAVYPEALVVPSLMFATTDTRHYMELTDNQYRFQGMIIETSQAKSIHGTNEYIGVKSYEDSIEIARQMMKLGSR